VTREGEFTVRGKVFEWRGPAPFHFIAVKGEVAEEIRDLASAVTYGWGMIPVACRVGDTQFTTSLWPKDGEYYLPLKDAVRTAEGITLGATITVLAAARDRHPESSLVTIDSLDVPRYLGAWYEIAKYPNRFQKQCDGYTTAHYSLQPDRSIQVVNRCRRADGRYEEAVGTARQLGPADSPKLQVRFAPGWLSFLPMVWGDYWVIDLDPAYQLVAVSEPQREFLWVLSRQPQVDPQAYQALLQRLIAQGFDPARLQWTPHGDTPATRPGTP